MTNKLLIALFSGILFSAPASIYTLLQKEIKQGGNNELDFDKRV